MRELNDYLDEALDPTMKADLQKHVSECPNCWVVCDTTQKTLKVFKGMEAQPISKDIQSRLFAAVEKKWRERGGKCNH